MTNTNSEAADERPTTQDSHVGMLARDPPALESAFPATLGDADSPVFPTWGGFGARCPDCGYTFVRETAGAAAEAVTLREEIHGRAFCKQLAAKLPAKEKARLERIYYGTNEPPPAATEVRIVAAPKTAATKSSRSGSKRRARK